MPAFDADVKRSQRAAMAKYPALAMASSPFNRAFLVRYEQWKQAGDSRFTRADWPELLADECSSQLTAQQPSPATTDTPIDIAAQIYPNPARAKATVAPVAAPVSSQAGRVWVKGYQRKDGTYVQGHYRDR